MKCKIYLLPGTMCDKNLWKFIKPYLENDYEFIHLDIPLKNSIDEICEEIILKMKDSKVNLLGFSLGAYLASYISVKYPSRISRLMLIGNSASSLPLFEIQKRKNIIEQLNTFGFKTLSKKQIQVLLSKKNQDNEELISLIKEMYERLGKNAFSKQLKATLEREDLLNELAISKIPMHFVYSKDDKLVNRTWMEKLEKRNKKIQFSKINSSSHMLPLEESSLISTLCKDFF